MTRLLLTGFEPFGGETINPSWEAACAIQADPPAGVDLTILRLAVHPERAFAALVDAIDAARPDLIVALGQAGGRYQITPERVGINVLGYSEVDGPPQEQPIVPDGPAAYFTTLPIKAMVQAMHEAGVPAAVSNSAGTYLCNAVTYYTQHLLAERRLSIPAGFIHLPYLPQQVATRRQPTPSIALETTVLGVRIAIVRALSEQNTAQVVPVETAAGR